MGRLVVGRPIGKRSRRRFVRAGAPIPITFYPCARACLLSLCCLFVSHYAGILLPLANYTRLYKAQRTTAPCPFFFSQLQVSSRLLSVCGTTTPSLAKHPRMLCGILPPSMMNNRLRPPLQHARRLLPARLLRLPPILAHHPPSAPRPAVAALTATAAAAATGQESLECVFGGALYRARWRCRRHITHCAPDGGAKGVGPHTTATSLGGRPRLPAAGSRGASGGGARGNPYWRSRRHGTRSD